MQIIYGITPQADDAALLLRKNEDMFESFTSPALTASAQHTIATTLTAEEAFEGTWIGGLQNWVDGLPEALQWLGVIGVSTIPLIESYTGTFLGVLIGMPWWAALLCAIVGNTIIIAVLVYGAHSIRAAITRRREPQELSEKQVARRAKIKKNLDRFGVPGVSILGPLALPSQFTAPLMVSFGASRNLVMIWTFVSIVLWGALFALLGVGLLNLLAG